MKVPYKVLSCKNALLNHWNNLEPIFLNNLVSKLNMKKVLTKDKL